jgi:penicillin V acylase-like amidase (Ntn superfamily)
MVVKRKKTIKDLEEILEKLTNDLSISNRAIKELDKKLNSAVVSISRLKVYVDEELSKKTIVYKYQKENLNNNSSEITRSRAVEVYQEFKQKQKENE